MKQEKVLYESDEAARYVTGIKGWVDIHGHYHGNNEHMARYCSSTHKLCECGQEMTKSYTRCDSCREKAAIQRYSELPRAEWGEGMVYSEAADTYFSEWDEIEDHCEEHGCAIEDLRLLNCDPQYLGQIDSDHWEDVLPEDWGYHELPDAICEALDKLNAAIRDQPPISWYPGKTAVQLPSEAKAA